jgi:hypothetical protein
MIGQAEAAKSSLEDITIVTKAQYNETAAAQAVGRGTQPWSPPVRPGYL